MLTRRAFLGAAGHSIIPLALPALAAQGPATARSDPAEQQHRDSGRSEEKDRVAGASAASPGLAPDGRPLHFLSLQEVGRRLAAREVSPLALTQQLLERIAQVDPQRHSYATLMTEQALLAARLAEGEIEAGHYRGPLHEVPIALKDLFYTKGTRTMGGMALRRDFVPAFDATVVARLRAAGAVLLGKLNLTEGAMGGYHPDFAVPRNPWDQTRWAGVSSSGAGVATAAGLCFGALGTATLGSIRVPCAANGVVGLKPTDGRVSRFGVLPLAESLDHVGPMTRCVVDAAILFDAIAGPDPQDPTSLREPPPHTYRELGLGVAGLRLGLERDYALTAVDPGEAAAIEQALEVLVGLGARIVQYHMPDLTGVVEAAFLLCAVEAVAAQADYYPARASAYGPQLREFLQLGASVTHAQLAAAQERRAQTVAGFQTVLAGVDAIACPTSGSPAFPLALAAQYGSLSAFNAALGAALPPPRKIPLLFTVPMNFAGTPAICLPCGYSPQGLPDSIQFAGQRLSEPLLCRLAHAYEQATHWHTRHPVVAY